MKTTSLKKSQIQRAWHLIDVKGKVLGREATKIAGLLIGKDKPNLVDYLDCGDYVVVVNAGQVDVTGRKRKQKFYRRHSGFPGGFKEVRFDWQMAKDPTKIITHTVKGMLPKNKLRADRMARLKVFADDKHPYKDKLTKKEEKKE